MVITWNTPEEGKHNGTIACTNGHVQFRDVPPDRKAEHDDAVRELSNALKADPGTQAQVVSFLTGLGTKVYPLGAHTAFAALPTDWKTKIDIAVAAMTGAPDPALEPQTLEDLVSANPGIAKSMDDLAEKLGDVPAPAATDAVETPAATPGGDASAAAAQSTGKGSENKPKETPKVSEEKNT